MGNSYTPAQRDQVMDLVLDLPNQDDDPRDVLDRFVDRVERILYPSMTVRDLRESLEGLNPNDPVLVESGGWYSYLTALVRPAGAVDGVPGYRAPTLQIGRRMDPRDPEMDAAGTTATSNDVDTDEDIPTLPEFEEVTGAVLAQIDDSSLEEMEKREVLLSILRDRIRGGSPTHATFQIPVEFYVRLGFDGEQWNVVGWEVNPLESAAYYFGSGSGLDYLDKRFSKPTSEEMWEAVQRHLSYPDAVAASIVVDWEE